MFQTLAQDEIGAKQDPIQVFNQRSRSSNQLGYRSKQGKIYSKFLTKDLDQVASSGINQSQARFNPNTQTKIKIRQLAWA